MLMTVDCKCKPVVSAVTMLLWDAAACWGVVQQMMWFCIYSITALIILIRAAFSQVQHHQAHMVSSNEFIVVHMQLAQTCSTRS